MFYVQCYHSTRLNVCVHLRRSFLEPHLYMYFSGHTHVEIDSESDSDSEFRVASESEGRVY